MDGKGQDINGTVCTNTRAVQKKVPCVTGGLTMDGGIGFPRYRTASKCSLCYKRYRRCKNCRQSERCASRAIVVSGSTMSQLVKLLQTLGNGGNCGL